VGLSTMGVPLMIMHERTGLLANPPDVATYAEMLARAIRDKALRQRLGEGARRFALEERSGASAAEKLARIIDGVFAARENAA